MEAARKVKQEVGDVTILINNAGIMPHHQFLDHTEAEIRRIMDINVMAHFWVRTLPINLLVKLTTVYLIVL